MTNSIGLDLHLYPGLPKQTEYRHFSKKFLRKRVGKDEELTPYISVDSKYRINPDLLAVYDFKKAPRLGKYQSVLIDRERGIILSKRGSKAHFYYFLKHKLISGLAFQKAIDQRLHYRRYHVISTGKRAYFSIHGYTDGCTDWVALHLMEDYQLRGQHAIRFQALKINELDYSFTFAGCSRHIRSELTEGLRHNNLVFKVLQYHLEDTMGWSIYRLRGKEKSLLDKQEYFTPAPTIQFFTMQEVCADLRKQKYLWYGQTMAEYFQLKFFETDHNLIYRLSQRGDNIY